MEVLCFNFLELLQRAHRTCWTCPHDDVRHRTGMLASWDSKYRADHNAKASQRFNHVAVLHVERYLSCYSTIRQVYIILSWLLRSSRDVVNLLTTAQFSGCKVYSLLLTTAVERHNCPPCLEKYVVGPTARKVKYSNLHSKRHFHFENGLYLKQILRYVQ